MPGLGQFAILEVSGAAVQHQQRANVKACSTGSLTCLPDYLSKPCFPNIASAGEMRTLEDSPGYRLKIQSHSPLPNSQTEDRLEKESKRWRGRMRDKEGPTWCSIASNSHRLLIGSCRHHPTDGPPGTWKPQKSFPLVISIQHFPVRVATPPF